MARPVERDCNATRIHSREGGLKLLKPGTIIQWVTMVLLLVAIISFYSSNQKLKEKNNRLETKIETLTQDESSIKKEYRQLWDNYETLYTEKNGTANEALLTTTAELFSTVFNYRSEKEEDSVKARKERAAQYATNQALNGLFPKNSEDIVATVATVSKMGKEPEVFVMSSDEKALKALVVIDYSVSIAGSEAQKGTFMYKISFDPERNQVTQVKNLGEINLG